MIISITMILTERTSKLPGQIESIGLKNWVVKICQEFTWGGNETKWAGAMGTTR